ncbi:unnamed protein product [Darwinula stevensoni]|uniref:CDP-diacylglycerol--inositol 3-phosphatidyltransferase n=1 Tax=Darwinula stevensoni TaxID=69355 RepID=A0A7R8X066_9CRUS|nr:unnamed protein product [Darwinula stevensoni]CAG0881338.1 unnamed protein product [Darwinula stevensoni]
MCQTRSRSQKKPAYEYESNAITVLLFVPNIIGYFRLLLLLGAYVYFHEPLYFLPLYITSVLLDAVDGWAARRLHQISSFGAWLDIVVDCIGRAMVWTNITSWGYLIVCLEWLCFVCNHGLGPQWKDFLSLEVSDAPRFVRKVMENGFYNAMGFLAMSGIHLLPVLWYCIRKGIFDIFSKSSMGRAFILMSAVVLSMGRTIGAVVEGWCILSHVKFLLSQQHNMPNKKSN